MHLTSGASLAILAASIALAACGGGSPSPTPTTGVATQASPAAAPEREGLGRGDGFDVVQRAGIAMWSRRSGERYRLVMQCGAAAPVAVAVQPSPFPFDVDLGTDATGATVAVYSRCAVPAATREPGRVVRLRCRLVRLDAGTGEERRLNVPATSGASQVRPAINRGILAYAEVPDAGRGKARILLTRLGARSPPRTITSLGVGDPGDIVGIDYENERLAFAAVVADRAFAVLFLKEPGRPLQRLAAGGFGEENAQYVSSPSFAGRHLYFAFSNRHAYKPRNGFVVRRDLLTGQVTSDEVPGYLTAVAADAADPAQALVIVSDRSARKGPDIHAIQRLRRVRRPSFQDPPVGLGLRDALGLRSPA